MIMETINRNRTGLVFGTFLGGWHFMWVVLVALGWAQAVVDFVLRIHMIKPVYVVEPFNFWIATMLIALTGAIGYFGGFVLAALWNWLHREGHGEAHQHAGRSDWHSGGESSAR
jgi:hypothetical protein